MSSELVKDFDILYREGNVWHIWVEKTHDDQYFIKTEHGKKDGKLVKNERQIPKGKGKKTVEEQAIAEALSKWKSRQEKNGYRLTETHDEIIVRPMLANQLVIGKSKVKYPVMIQRKYDGVRCLSYLHPETGDVILESRQGKSYNNLHHIKDQLKKYLISKMYLDGELYSNDIPFEVISGTTRLDEGKPNEHEKKIQYHIYDCLFLEDLKRSFKDRWTAISAILPSSSTGSIQQVETSWAKSLDEIREYHAKYVEEGYEGVMIRNPKGPYTIRKRSNDLLKYKEFKEDEYPIIGYYEGEGVDKGTVIWECRTPEDKKFRVRPRGTVEHRKKMFNEADSMVGKNLTVIYQELTADGIPRFPVGKDIRDGY